MPARPRSPRWIALLLALLAGLPDAGRAAAASLDVKLDGVKGPEKVNVEGLLSIKRYAAQKDLADSRIRRLHEQAPGEIARALESFGYYNVRVTPSLDQNGDKYVATYRIEPGVPARLDTVDVRVTGAGERDTVLTGLATGFPLKVGDPVRHLDWELGKAAIAGQGHVRGYLDGAFRTHEIAVDPNSNRARLTLVYDTGARYLFGPVRFEQDALEQRYLDGYVTFKEGEPLDFDRLRSFQNSLRSTSYFGRIEVEPDRAAADGLRVPIDVRLERAPSMKIELGASYGTDEGFGGLVGVNFRRVNRHGHRADFQVQAAQRKQNATANYRIPWASPPTSVLSLTSGFEHEDTDTRTNTTFLAGTSFTRLRGSWQETLALTYRDETYEVGPDDGRSQLFGPDLQWSVVKADDRVFTRRGFRVRVGVQGSWHGALASVSYGQANLDLKGIRGGKSPHRLIGRVHVGHTWSDQFRELPASIRYYAGGAQSIRGYGYESLTPHDANGEPIGGNSILESTAEYDYRLHHSWAVATFYDYGGALESASDPLSSGAGIGIRWLSPVGMIRLDYAWALSRDGTPTEVHFMIGPDL